MFLKDNGDIYARYDKDQTLLNTTAYFNNAEVAKLLLEHNVDTKSRDESEKTTLLTATHYNSRKAVKLLLEHMVNTLVDKETPLHTAVSCNNTEMAELVLNYKAEIEAKGLSSHTHIDNAVRYSKKAMVQLLLKHL